MPLPSRVEVKISSEAAGSISLTRVVVREMPPRELAEVALGVCGFDPARIKQILERGSIVSGASRFRWSALSLDDGELELLLEGVPRPEPTRPFSPEACVRISVRGRSQTSLEREAGSKRRFLRRSSFWKAAMELARSAMPEYLDYSYSEKADRYSLALTPELQHLWREAVALLPYDALRHQFLAASDLEFLSYRS